MAGIGFTVSLLISDISFERQELVEAKLGILGASILAAVLSWVAFESSTGLSMGRRVVAVAPIVDLSDPVDPDVDHVRGSLDAPLMLVEYGDFECPHCLSAEGCSTTSSPSGDDMAFVFRHLPLDQVHVHARLRQAAEAAKRRPVLEMPDALFAHQDALSEPDLRSYAADLGLDVDRFTGEQESRRHALPR